MERNKHIKNNVRFFLGKHCVLTLKKLRILFLQIFDTTEPCIILTSFYLKYSLVVRKMHLINWNLLLCLVSEEKRISFNQKKNKRELIAGYRQVLLTLEKNQSKLREWSCLREKSTPEPRVEEFPLAKTSGNIIWDFEVDFNISWLP